MKTSLGLGHRSPFADSSPGRSRAMRTENSEEKPAMGYTLDLEDTLAEELRQEASAERIAVAELAHCLLRDALQQRVAQKRWRAQNRRRLELIAKKRQAALSAEEQEELG